MTENGMQTINTSHYIGGEFVKGTLEPVDIIDKYDRKILGTINAIDDHQLETAIANAAKARTMMSKLSSEHRYQQLMKLADLIAQDRTHFADLIVAEAGKPIESAKGEVSRSIATVQLAAQAALQMCGPSVNIDMQAGLGMACHTIRKPKGVVLALAPYNFPLNLALHKLGPALAAGCPIILKPSHHAPLSCFHLATLLQTLDFPPGAITVMHCSNDQSERLIQDERVKVVSFTGSDQVGWHLKTLAPTKTVVLELGGNSAAIVGQYSDIDNAAKQLSRGAFLYAGQICISTQRVIVVESQRQALQAALIETMKSIQVGNPKDSDVMVGPMISQQAFEKTQALVNEAIDKGARVVFQAGRLDVERHLYPATLLENVDSKLSIYRDEAFAPILILESANDFFHAVERANDSRYGLQAGVFTDRIDEMRFAHQNLAVGGVIINHPPGFRVDSMPYGGVKSSGVGREGPRFAIEDMTDLCTLIV